MHSSCGAEIEVPASLWLGFLAMTTIGVSSFRICDGTDEDGDGEVAGVMSIAIVPPSGTRSIVLWDIKCELRLRIWALYAGEKEEVG